MSIKERLTKFGSSYLVVALIAAKDLVELGIGLFKADVSFFNILTPFEWLDLAVRLLFAFGVVQIFRYYQSMKEEFDKIKEDQVHFKAELGDYLSLMGVINTMRMQKDFEGRYRPSSEAAKIDMLKETMEGEKQWLQDTVPKVFPDKTADYWYGMIDGAYPVKYGTGISSDAPNSSAE